MAKKKKIVRPQYVPKEERQKQQPKEPMSKGLKYGLIAGACVLVIAIVLFAIFYDDGSLPSQDSVVVTEGDNWIVVNKGTNTSPKFYKQGEIEPMDGYVLDENLSDTDARGIKTFAYAPEDELDPVKNYQVRGVNSKPEEIIESVYTSYGAWGSYLYDMHPIQTVTLDGREVTYFIADGMTVPEEEGEGEDTTAEDTTDEAASQESTQVTQEIICYVPSIRDTCILILLTVEITEDQPPLEEAELLAKIEEAISHITFEVE